VLEQPITLSRILVLVGLVIAVLIYAISTGYFEDAEAGKCYGIYCDDDKKDTKTTVTEKKIEGCYGIHCDRDETSETIEKQQEDWLDLQKTRNYIAIQISKTCQISGTCPTYKELADLYDNSDKYLSGDFYLNNNTGLWEREEPPIYKSFEYYRFMNLPWIVFVDPDDYTWDRSKQIVIHSELLYQDRRDIFENQILIQYVGLKMDGCKSASIGWTNQGEQILLDVLNYFYSKCKSHLDYDPRIETFINSTIFPDCDRLCFHFKDLLKKEMRVDQILEMEKWEERFCSDDDESDYTSITSYDRNKEECDRIKISLGGEVDDDDEPCYGIYCDRDEEKDDKTKTALELRQERLRDLQQIQDCKEEQIWDEIRIEGGYRRVLYDCDDEEEREEYMDIILCESIYDVDVDCNDDDEREDQLKELSKDSPEKLLIQECEDYKSYELTIPDRRSRALIVTCEDDFEREEYMQEMYLIYPDGIPEEFRTTYEEEEEESDVKCYGIHCD